MTHRYSRPLAIAYFVTLSFWLSAPLAIDANQAPMKLYEIPMRSMVKDKPKPNYPASAVAKNTSGVAVVMISVTSKGVVESAVVLQSPGPEFSDSVSAAVQKWVFSAVAPVGREPLPFRGKLTFYFDVENGTGRVREISDFKAGAAMLRPGAPVARSGTPNTGEAPSAAPITPAELAQLSKSAKVFLIDIRERDAFRRGARPNAINIPYDELAVRAVVEVPEKSVAVIDCTQEEESGCRVATRALQDAGRTGTRILK